VELNVAAEPRAARANPDPYRDTFTRLVAARAVIAATTLGIFDALHGSAATAPELASQLGLDPLGAEILLGTLAALGYVEPSVIGFRNSAVAERDLVTSSPTTIATFAGLQAELHWQVLDQLPEALRAGQDYGLHERRRDEPSLWEGYIRGLYEISREDHDGNAALVGVRDPSRMVDVAGGHGAFAMAMCRRHPKLEATVVDLPPSVAVGRRIVHEQGFDDRISFSEGDVFEIGIGNDLDVVSVFNLLHHLPAERNELLCWKAYRALRPGGWFVIGDSAAPEPDQTMSEHGAISSILFYAWSHGRNFRPSEMRGWLVDAGFVNIESQFNPAAPWRIVVTARRPTKQAVSRGA
jgi:SAM-dependent methyltransferase